MDVDIHGITNRNDLHSKMLAIQDACDAAGVDYPSQLNDYLINRGWVDISEAVRENAEELGEYLIDLSKIPDGVRYIQVNISE